MYFGKLNKGTRPGTLNIRMEKRSLCNLAEVKGMGQEVTESMFNLQVCKLKNVLFFLPRYQKSTKAISQKKSWV